MGCKAQTANPLTIHNFSLDEMYEENYSLQQIYRIFKQLDKNWKALEPKKIHILEEIYDFLEENYYKCYVCGDYFKDHAFVDENATRQECYSCFTETDFY